MSMHQKPQDALSARPWSYHAPRFQGGPDWIEDADGNEIILQPGPIDGPFLVAAVNDIFCSAPERIGGAWFLTPRPGAGCDDLQPDLALPFSVQINQIHFNAGTRLSALLSRARVWHKAYLRYLPLMFDGDIAGLAMVFRTIARMARDESGVARGDDIALVAQKYADWLDGLRDSPAPAIAKAPA